MARAVESARSSAGTVSSSGWILGLLFAGNVLNFYDRALPSVVLEPIKQEYGLSDTQIGVLASAFVLCAALTAVPLGRLADRAPRRSVAGYGLLVWSGFTALGGFMVSFGVFFLSRVGVGIGEASYAPAAGSLISDLYPAERRSRATALFTLGFPIGTLLAFLTAAAIAEAFGTWRAPFLVAAVPGLILVVFLLRVREPRRGAADGLATSTPRAPADGRRSLSLSVLRIPSLWGIIIAFAGYNFAAYAIGTFITPVLQRYFGLGLVAAGIAGGLVVGVTGLVGLLAAGPVLDRATARSASRRDLVGAVSLGGAALFSVLGLAAGPTSLVQFIVFLGLGYLLGIVFLAVFVPATADVVVPKERSTALGVVTAAGLFVGGAGGPIAVGGLSTALAAGAQAATEAQASATGLQNAMLVLVPIAFVVAAAGMIVALAFGRADRARMKARAAARADPEGRHTHGATRDANGETQ